jgi:hypothetical protein
MPWAATLRDGRSSHEAGASRRSERCERHRFLHPERKCAERVIVSAGRDIVPFNENTDLRTTARDLQRGNTLSIAESRRNHCEHIHHLARGDLQISGEGVLECSPGGTWTSVRPKPK